ncbi:MAG: sigma-70 family RNA polymerase sigma factor [Muribaculaceae bacterium]|nr:sigma-70 family RNA polymerase sigma factor [Muribaculaceae bacterium]MDE6345093.1 sigma-70 family RNA polymerase sigma factor [Muribaculaceae bacterium]
MQYSITEFETIYLRCFPPAMRLAISLLHDEDDARDAVQEVFLRLWESDTGIENPQAFVIRSVRNVCLNRIAAADTRERFRRRYSLDEPDDGVDIEARHSEIRSAVQTLLTQRERQVVDKIYADGLSYKETAASLEVSVSMINKSVVTALKKLRTHFKTNK